MFRRSVLFAASVAAAAGGVLVPAHAAFAVTTFTSCANGAAPGLFGTATFQPGLAKNPANQAVGISGTFTDCTTPTNPNIVGGRLSANLVEPLATGCPPGPVPGTIIGTGTGTIVWSNGSISNVAVTLKSTGVFLQQKLVLKVTAGTFVGTPANPTKAKPVILLTPTIGSVCSKLSPITAASFLNVTNPVVFQSAF
jgi:hypothetical protein